PAPPRGGRRGAPAPPGTGPGGPPPARRPGCPPPPGSPGGPSPTGPLRGRRAWSQSPPWVEGRPAPEGGAAGPEPGRPPRPSPLVAERAVHLFCRPVQEGLDTALARQGAIDVRGQDVAELAHDRVLDGPPGGQGRVGPGEAEGGLEGLPDTLLIVGVLEGREGGGQHLGQVLGVIDQVLVPQEELDPLLGGLLVGALAEDGQVAPAGEGGAPRRPRRRRHDAVVQGRILDL